MSVTNKIGEGVVSEKVSILMKGILVEGILSEKVFFGEGILS